MRFVSLLVAFCFSLNVMASTGTVQELERSMDDFHYALSVEWDQKDQAFYEAQTKIFFEKMNDLIVNGGLTQDEILKLVESKSKNKAAIEALKLKLSLLPKNLSTTELADIVKQNAKDFYAEGASWNGYVVYSVVLGVVIIGAIAYSIWWSATHECVAYENQYVCTQQSNCYYTGGSTAGGYSYDMYGNWVSPGYTCYGPSYTTCGYQDVCTQYAKK
jgi:hypothetical protein